MISKILIVLAFIIFLSSLKKPKNTKRSMINFSIVNRLEKMSHSPLVRLIHEKPGTPKYRKKKSALERANINLSPEAYDTISLMVPLIVFVLAIAVQASNLINARLNLDQLKRIAELIGDSSYAEVKFKINWIMTIALSIATVFLPSAFLKILEMYWQSVSHNEIVMLQTYTIMMLRTRQSIKSILMTLQERAIHFKPQLQMAVNSYSQNPYLSLQELRKSAGGPEFEKIVISLEQALKYDRDISIQYMESHRTLGKELSRIALKERNEKKKVFGLLMLTFPLLMMFTLAGYPWVIFTLKAIDSLPV